MREVITLQFGERSNFLGTHFWNAQEAYFTYTDNNESQVDHDIHWRTGLSPKGEETFTPRCIIYDLKGSFGPLPKVNSLYEASDNGVEAASWAGPTTIHREPPIRVGEYQRGLDLGNSVALNSDEVKYWSDYNRVFFHPRSSIQINERDLTPSLSPMENHSTGEELFLSLDRENDIIDTNTRPFVEEADQLQGFQVMATLDDAWGGFASKYLERLRDEYGKSTVLVWGQQSVVRGLSREKISTRLLNRSKSIIGFCKESSILVPLRLPSTLPDFVHSNRSSSWHVSAVLATAVETAALSSRLTLPSSNRADTLGEIADVLNPHGQHQIAGVQLGVSCSGPFGNALSTPRNGEDIRSSTTQTHQAHGSNLYTDLDMKLTCVAESDTSKASRSDHTESFGQFAVFREDFLPERPSGDSIGIETDLDSYSVQRSVRTKLLFPLPDSFPGIYQQQGRAVRGAVSVRTVLSTNSSMSAEIKWLRNAVSISVPLEDRELLGSELADIADEYQNKWSTDESE